MMRATKSLLALFHLPSHLDGVDLVATLVDGFGPSPCYDARLDQAGHRAQHEDARPVCAPRVVRPVRRISIVGPTVVTS
jgi:hypothetical protein